MIAWIEQCMLVYCSAGIQYIVKIYQMTQNEKVTSTFRILEFHIPLGLKYNALF